MLKLIARRLALGIVTLLVVSVLIFASTQILPGDVATAILGQSATPETVAAIRRDLGLDRPAPVRYAEWLGGFVRGDLGRSLANNRPVAGQIGQRLGNTLFLAGVAALIAVPLAVGLGVLAAIRRESWLDRVDLDRHAVDDLGAGVLRRLRADHPPGRAVPGLPEPRHDHARHGPARRALRRRAAGADPDARGRRPHDADDPRGRDRRALPRPYIEMARLKGLPRAPASCCATRCPTRSAPIATVIALNLAYLVVGVVVVEVVFVYPGIGQYMVDAVTKRDVPAVQACALVFATTYVLLNLTADMLGIVSNPRLRHPR